MVRRCVSPVRLHPHLLIQLLALEAINTYNNKPQAGICMVTFYKRVSGAPMHVRYPASVCNTNHHSDVTLDLYEHKLPEQL